METKHSPTTAKERTLFGTPHVKCCGEVKECGLPTCMACKQPWPCFTHRLIADVERQGPLVGDLVEALAWAMPWLQNFPLPRNDQPARDDFAAQLEQMEDLLLRYHEAHPSVGQAGKGA